MPEEEQPPITIIEARKPGLISRAIDNTFVPFLLVIIVNACIFLMGKYPVIQEATGISEGLLTGFVSGLLVLIANLLKRKLSDFVE